MCPLYTFVGTLTAAIALALPFLLHTILLHLAVLSPEEMKQHNLEPAKLVGMRREGTYARKHSHSVVTSALGHGQSAVLQLPTSCLRNAENLAKCEVQVYFVHND